MFNQKSVGLFLFGFFFLSQYLFSQIVLQGTVTDNGGEYLGGGAEPVVNARVMITDQADESRFFYAFTNVQGEYSIQITQTDVDDRSSRHQDDFRLFQNYPNPFNPSTIIGFNPACGGTGLIPRRLRRPRFLLFVIPRCLRRGSSFSSALLMSELRYTISWVKK